jgi:hypothetical protein
MAFQVRNVSSSSSGISRKTDRFAGGLASDGRGGGPGWPMLAGGMEEFQHPRCWRPFSPGLPQGAGPSEKVLLRRRVGSEGCRRDVVAGQTVGPG